VSAVTTTQKKKKGRAGTADEKGSPNGFAYSLDVGKKNRLILFLEGKGKGLSVNGCGSLRYGGRGKLLLPRGEKRTDLAPPSSPSCEKGIRATGIQQKGGEKKPSSRGCLNVDGKNPTSVPPGISPIVYFLKNLTFLLRPNKDIFIEKMVATFGKVEAFVRRCGRRLYRSAFSRRGEHTPRVSTRGTARKKGTNLSVLGKRPVVMAGPGR